MTTLEGPADRYRRRRHWPIVALVAVMFLGAGVVWFQILKPAPPVTTACNLPGPVEEPTTSARSRTSTPTTGASGASSAPATTATTAPASTAGSTTTSAPTLGSFVDTAGLASTRPANPQTVALRVYNGARVVGMAGTVTKELREAGFLSIREQADDPLYPAYDLNCYGQIRFGAAGLAQARTVLMVAPCAQLVMDDRIDASVELAVGALYRFDGVSPETRAQLQQIINDSAPPPVIEGQTAAARPLSPIPPLPDVDCSAGAPPRPAPVDSPPSSSPSAPSSPSTPASPTTALPPADGTGTAEQPSTSQDVPETTTDTPDPDESAEAPEFAPQEGDNVFG